jgi:adenylate cyclase
LRPGIAYRLKKAALLGILIGAWGVFLALPVVSVGLDLEESLGLNWLFSMRGPIKPPNGIIVVNTSTDAGWRLRSIDGAVQRWPCLRDLEKYRKETWPRCLHAALVDTLHRRGASVVAFDIDFEEDASWDPELAAVIDLTGNVVLKRSYEIRNGEAIAGEVSTRLAPVARGLGPWILPKDPARRVDRYWTFNAQLGNAPTLPVMALQVCSKPLLSVLFKALNRARPDRFHAPDKLSADLKGEDTFKLMQDVRLAMKELPGTADRVLEDVQTEVGASDSASSRCIIALTKAYGGRAGYFADFYGPLGTILTIDGDALLTQELRGEVQGPQDPFKDAAVFVGVSGAGMASQRDAHYTVFSRADGVDLTGVEIAATAFANLLTDRPIRQLSNYQAFACLLAFGLLVGGVAYGIPGLSGSLAALSIAIGYAAVAFLQFRDSGIWILLVIPLLAQLPLALFCGSVLQYLAARRERANIRRAMHYYVPKDVADSAALSGSVSHGAEMFYGVCLTTDIEGYTAVSQQESPQDLATALNKYYDLVSEPAAQHGCDIFDFTADRMMCVWSSAQSVRKIRLDACLAAINIRERIDAFNRVHSAHALPTRIGLNAGRLALANIGGGGRGSYSPVGEVPNGAERVEGLNKILKTRLLASGEVVEGLEELALRRIGSFIPYGMLSPFVIYEIWGLHDVLVGDLKERCVQYEAALSAFERGNWSEAMTLFDGILAAWPKDGPSAYLRDRSRHYLSAPPNPDSPWIMRVETK